MLTFDARLSYKYQYKQAIVQLKVFDGFYSISANTYLNPYFRNNFQVSTK